MINKEEKTYLEYKKETNMTYKDLLNWSNNKISRLASVSPIKETEQAKLERRKLLRYAIKYNIPNPNKYYTAQLRNLVLLKIPKNEWDLFLINQSKKSVSYLKRAKKIKSNNFVNDKYTFNDIALKNWGYKR